MENGPRQMSCRDAALVNIKIPLFGQAAIPYRDTSPQHDDENCNLLYLAPFRFPMSNIDVENCCSGQACDILQ